MIPILLGIHLNTFACTAPLPPQQVELAEYRRENGLSVLVESIDDAERNLVGDPRVSHRQRQGETELAVLRAVEAEELDVAINALFVLVET